jgi:L-cysteine:1D-myo-inositol 2-amino-2-deoxy-alpha-D-glucopyranoside ligase
MAEQRLATWRRAVASASGAPAEPVLSGVRERLADDLDSPGAIALVDAWAAQTLAGGADLEAEAPRIVSDAVDALLGVALDSCAEDKALDRG